MAVKIGDLLTLKLNEQQVRARIVNIHELQSDAYVPADTPNMITRRIVTRLDDDPAQEYETLVPVDQHGWQLFTIADLENLLGHKLQHSGELPTEAEKAPKAFNAVKLGGGDLQR